MKRFKNIKVKLLLTAAYLIITAVLIHFGAECIMKHFFGIPCPGCGMTHALLSVIRFDFISAFRHHAMFWSMPILYLYFLADGNLFKSKLINRIIFVGIVVGFAVNWIVKLF